MNLVFGCSHVLGDELDQDLLHHTSMQEKIKYIENNRFSNLLFKKLDLPVKVYGSSGADNSWIAHKVVDVVENYTSPVNNVIVCWSGPTRMQKIIDGGTFFLNPLYPGHFSNSLKDKFPDLINDLLVWEEIESKVFLDINFCNKVLYHSANYIKHYLDNKGINLIFLKSVESDINLKKLTNQSINLSFHEFYNGKFNQGTGGHCLSEGHSKWADYLFKHLKHYIIK